LDVLPLLRYFAINLIGGCGWATAKVVTAIIVSKSRCTIVHGTGIE
jgi:hypothetical protein